MNINHNKKKYIMTLFAFESLESHDVCINEQVSLNALFSLKCWRSLNVCTLRVK